MINFDEIEGYGCTVRPMTQQADFWRLLFIRSRRMLLLSTKLVDSFEVYTAWVKYLDQFLRVLALYQACVLIPRFVINVFYVSRRLLGHASDDMIVRCWEMAYDFGWIMNGVLAAFILVGPLAPWVVYLPVLTPSYQLCVHTTRFLLENYYGQAMDEKLAVRMGVSVCIITTGLVMLLGASNPAVAFTAAVLAVAVTLLSKWLTKNLGTRHTSAVPDESLRAGLHRWLGLFAYDSPGDIITNKKEHDTPLVLHEKSC
ncbi:MAG: hypothetical protein P1U39_02960 [Legionellaceae bacterium]|jgi:hypothetical protein|nr:hypothetical protein [Legionellaceae bacterium]